ncbi:hypothetical protein B0H17DRAFT_1137896 [Mycena rosella]|uniref:Uncharacterized protein n=1 Tax=Mycena rosella TaxID=1033263 RepID=A0AAD7GA80_MYCRO|nr:hypothetical protein B0H17DRAFT_1137896 [Mycena rosella]
MLSRFPHCCLHLRRRLCVTFCPSIGDLQPQFRGCWAINQSNLVVDVVNGKLTLEETDSSKQTQLWEIDYQQCFSGTSTPPGGGEFAVGCLIKSVSTGLCALEMGSEFLGLAESDAHPVAAETFTFWTTTSTIWRLINVMNVELNPEFPETFKMAIICKAEVDTLLDYHSRILFRNRPNSRSYGLRSGALRVLESNRSDFCDYNSGRRASLIVKNENNEDITHSK